MKSPGRTEWPGLSHVPAVLHRGAIALGPNAQRVSTGAASALALVLNAVLAKTAVTGQEAAWAHCWRRWIIVVVVQRLAV